MGKAEVERRMAEEIDVPFTDVQAPEYLKGKSARDEFDHYAGMLLEIGIFTELDVDCLARYILSKNLYLQYTAKLARMLKQDNDSRELAATQTLQDKAFKQCQACASSLGLTISSRCKLTVPVADDASDYEL